jgi:curved DNA-binding protein
MARTLATMKTHYHSLGVPERATAQQIKSCYRLLVKRYHPDLFPGGSEAQAEAGERLREINAAYAVLSNPEKRARYDEKLKRRAALHWEPKPEYCDRCGQMTLYWYIGKNVTLCSACGRHAR